MRSDFTATVAITGTIHLDPEGMEPVQVVTSRGNLRQGTPSHLMVEYTYDVALGWVCTHLVMVACYITQDGRYTKSFRSRVMRSADGQDAHTPHAGDLPAWVGPCIDKHRPDFMPPAYRVPTQEAGEGR